MSEGLGITGQRAGQLSNVRADPAHDCSDQQIGDMNRCLSRILVIHGLVAMIQGVRVAGSHAEVVVDHVGQETVDVSLKLFAKGEYPCSLSDDTSKPERPHVRILNVLSLRRRCASRDVRFSPLFASCFPILLR